MRVYVVREATIRPGNSTWMDLGDELVFTTSAAGMTAEGAESLQACWAAFIDAGVWRWKATGGVPITTTYHRELPQSGDEVEIATRPGFVEVWLHPDHFAEATVAGLQRAATDCIACGWTWHDVPLLSRERAA